MSSPKTLISVRLDRLPAASAVRLSLQNREIRAGLVALALGLYRSYQQAPGRTANTAPSDKVTFAPA
jgi:hypothetical protein